MNLKEKIARAERNKTREKVEKIIENTLSEFADLVKIGQMSHNQVTEIIFERIDALVPAN